MRVVSLPLINPEKLRADQQYPYASRQWGELDGVNAHDEQGHPIIESQSHEMEVAARNGLKRV